MKGVIKIMQGKIYKERELNFQDYPVCPRFNDLVGKVFHRLTVIGYAGKIHQHFWFCRCICGSVIKSGAWDVQYRTKSCGCLQRERASQSNSSHKLSHSAALT